MVHGSQNVLPFVSRGNIFAEEGWGMGFKKNEQFRWDLLVKILWHTLNGNGI